MNARPVICAEPQFPFRLKRDFFGVKMPPGYRIAARNRLDHLLIERGLFGSLDAVEEPPPFERHNRWSRVVRVNPSSSFREQDGRTDISRIAPHHSANRSEKSALPVSS